MAPANPMSFNDQIIPEELKATLNGRRYDSNKKKIKKWHAFEFVQQQKIQVR